MTKNSNIKTPPALARVRREAAQRRVDALRSSLAALEARAEAVTEDGLDLGDPEAVQEAAATLLAVEKGAGMVSGALEVAQRNLYRAVEWQSDQPRLAQAIAEVLGSEIHASKAEAVFSVPSGDADRPKIYVEQSQPDSANDDGVLSGSVKIVIQYPAWMGDSSAAEAPAKVLRTLRDSGRVRIQAPDAQLLVGTGITGGRCTLRLPAVVVVPEESEGDAA